MTKTADQANDLGDVLSSTLKPWPGKSSNWLSPDVSVHLEFHVKLNLALCYLSKLIREHPSWPDTFIESGGEGSYSEESMIQYEKSNDSLKQSYMQAWLRRKLEALLFMVRPFLIAHDGCNAYEVDMVNLKNLISSRAFVGSEFFHN
ncbi:hypothetical protein KIW84_050674 [Lathyrus oleraceus]|uniref:Uncharacterized protein n=1 Tax=Pisum sativum TaxID=3888 RepID=A0A9D5ACE8_PEA|nr:hypothetical protein KIW84_050674 [Pisum sativum]